MSLAVHFSNKNCEWATPHYLFSELDYEFHFTLDVCASRLNHKVDRYFDQISDGLAQDWGKNVCWMNPPYGKETAKWLAKANESAKFGATVVCLLPARTDVSWWHEIIIPCASEVRFIRGRIRFNPDGAVRRRAPFPSAIVIFRPKVGDRLCPSCGRNPCSPVCSLVIQGRLEGES